MSTRELRECNIWNGAKEGQVFALTELSDDYPFWAENTLDRLEVHQHKLYIINQKVLEIQLVQGQYSNLNIMCWQVDQYINDLFFFSLFF